MRLETCELGKRFGGVAALDGVSLVVRPGSVHALLGENGAGKSTLVKAIAGVHRPDAGAVLVDGRERDIGSPAAARALGIGMVYQHFTVVPGMTVAENLLLARGRVPAIVRWKAVRAELEAFMATAPFALALDALPLALSAGERQKLEILKQLFLRPRLLILDEPTSVLTPQEADEVLGALRARAHAGQGSVLLITHKFREVMAFADDVSVLRRGRLVHAGAVAATGTAQLAGAMVGDARAAPQAPPPARPARSPGEVRLAIQGLAVAGDRGGPAVHALSLQVRAGEIVGIAGVAGNGQRELMEALAGQRPRRGGSVVVDGAEFGATRAEMRRLAVRALPEEPLHNACVPTMSVAQNLALRDFDAPPLCTRLGWLRPRAWRAHALALIERQGVKAPGPQAPMRALSGGNVQRAVLARELHGAQRLLLVSNPAFGLDFGAVAAIHQRLREARDAGAAVLLVSEDLDELLALADRVVVMSEGRLVHETGAAGADRAAIGSFMGGRAHAAAVREAA